MTELWKNCREFDLPASVGGVLLCIADQWYGRNASEQPGRGNEVASLWPLG